MYISELKEHVIIQGKAQGVTENGQYQEQVGHLIIDGQVSYKLRVRSIYF